MTSTSNFFLYFAYGSNLLLQRIHINNPSATRAGIGKLKNYRLDFVTYSNNWKGAAATIVPTEGGHVWGALWEINNDDMPHLDRQEGVNSHIYFPLTVNVETPDGQIRKCRTYQQTANITDIVPLENLPKVRQPSGVYMQTILKGANQSGLPEEYQTFLKKIAHNGYTGEVDIGNLNLD